MWFADDPLQTDNPEFRRLAESGRWFNSTETKFMESKFMGMDFKKANDNSIELDMDNFVDNFELSPVQSTYNSYRSMRAKLAWIAN